MELHFRPFVLRVSFPQNPPSTLKTVQNNDHSLYHVRDHDLSRNAYCYVAAVGCGLSRLSRNVHFVPHVIILYFTRFVHGYAPRGYILHVVIHVIAYDMETTTMLKSNY